MTADKDLVQSSYGACCLSPTFFDDFYDAFLASSSVIAGKFVNTDMAKQKRLLRDGISFMIMYFNGTAVGRMKVEKLGESHSQGRMDIKPQWYDLWVNALVKTVAKHDPKFSPAADRAWRAVLARGIDAMRSQYYAPVVVGV
jgi:hemoglobin-like flavoprotein